MVSAIVIIPSIVRTTLDGAFISHTMYVIKPNMTIALTKNSKFLCNDRIFKSKLTTDNLCILDIPEVVTNGSPVTIVKQFYPAFPISVTINKAQRLI